MGKLRFKLYGVLFFYLLGWLAACLQTTWIVSVVRKEANEIKRMLGK